MESIDYHPKKKINRVKKFKHTNGVPFRKYPRAYLLDKIVNLYRDITEEICLASEEYSDIFLFFLFSFFFIRDSLLFLLVFLSWFIYMATNERQQKENVR